jgi:hypothetical protein
MLAKPVVAKKEVGMWRERGLALVAAVNLGLVYFDLSYVPWRSFYLRSLPGLTKVYDPIKGIEPHRDTSKYLQTVDKLRQQNLQSPAAAILLQDLVEQSVRTIETNPFQLAGKTGSLEKIKNRMRDHMGKESAKDSFRLFWNPANLTAARSAQELAYFDREIRPLWAANYFRETGEDGDFVDWFWAIDGGFVGIFAIDLLLRAMGRRRQYPNRPWRSILLERWYDWLLLIPLVRWLRVLPVAARWHQAQLIDLSQWQDQVNRMFVQGFADELTQTVVTQVLGQAQSAIASGTAGQLMREKLFRPQVDLNNVNEVEAIAQLILEVTIYRVLPKIQPDLEQLAARLLQQSLVESPALQSLKLLPGFTEAPQQIIENIVRQVSDALYLGLTKALNDPQNGRLAKQLADHLTAAVGTELQKGQTIDKIESLVVDLLAELRASYDNP